LSEEIEQLRLENQQLKARISELERELAMRPRSRRKGAGAHYATRIIMLNKKHRQLLYGLFIKGATNQLKAIPAIELRRMFHLRTAPTAGRMSELIGKGYVNCSKVRIAFQLDGEGALQYRPETELDANLGIKKYKRFVYWITDAGIEALHRELKPSDEFIKVPELEVWLRVASPEQVDEIRKLIERGN
jgi:hypothetical protein